jgi:hypothetical protein
MKAIDWIQEMQEMQDPFIRPALPSKRWKSSEAPRNSLTYPIQASSANQLSILSHFSATTIPHYGTKRPIPRMSYSGIGRHPFQLGTNASLSDFCTLRTNQPRNVASSFATKSYGRYQYLSLMGANHMNARLFSFGVKANSSSP